MRADSKWTVGFRTNYPFPLTTEKTTFGLSRIVQRLEREQQRRSPGYGPGGSCYLHAVRHSQRSGGQFSFRDFTDSEVQNRQAGQTFVFRRATVEHIFRQLISETSGWHSCFLAPILNHAPRTERDSENESRGQRGKGCFQRIVFFHRPLQQLQVTANLPIGNLTCTTPL